MIPGGHEGMRSLHRLSIGREHMETDEREAALADYIKRNPSHGPRPAMIERWNDPDYAEAVICGRDNRLTADQVREIRYRAVCGMAPKEISGAVGALNLAQVERVLAGRTYSRIS
jgi:hypothetical protein